MFIPLDVKRGKPNEPFAIKLCIDWSILGGSPNVQTYSRVQINFISGEDVFLNNQLEEFWKIESYGTTNCKTIPMSIQDRRS